MRKVPWWIVVPASAAPVLLVGGWWVAQLLQGPRYDPVTTSISVLGAYGAPGYWVLTGALLALGACYLAIAAGLRQAATAGRVALGGGGAASLALTLVPAPSSGGSLHHGAIAAVGFVLLALWPVFAAGRGDRAAPWALRPGPAAAASALMWVGAAWFWIELHRDGVPRLPGAAERVVTLAQALWPLLVVLSCARAPRPYTAAGDGGREGGVRRTVRLGGSAHPPGADSSAPGRTRPSSRS
ncbi:DUF998 domain-containing protein [Streptomyces tremellae]